MEQTVGEHMAAVRVGTKLDFIHRHKIGTDFQRHRLDGADPIGGAVGYDPLLAGHQSHNRGATRLDTAVIDLARQKAQRQTDDAGAMHQHPFDGIVGFAGVGRPEDRRDPCGFAHQTAALIRCLARPTACAAVRWRPIPRLGADV